MASVALQKYLPRLVLEWDDLAPGQNHRRIDGSMVFVDVSGFTKMSERLARHGKIGAEEVTEVINNTFDRLLAEAYAYGANLLKFGGDALLLFFEGDLHPHRAAAAASGMRQTLTNIGRFETTAGKVLLRMSVGMHSGTFDFFLVGGSHREFIVAGPAATHTTAMESAASAGQILVSPEAAARLPKRNVGRALGPGFLLASRVGGVEKGAIQRAAKAKTDLTQFVPVGLRATLASGEAEAEHRTAAVGFIHYMHFDQMVESSPEAAAKALDSLVRTVQEAIDRKGVTFLASDAAGDGGKLILTAGVPTSTGNDEERMLLALREIASSQPPIPLHIGVNWGPVFAGEVGPAYRKTYTVMGDTVNLAARLMAKAAPGEIYTVREVLDGSRTTFETIALEPFLVKGKKKPIQAFSVREPIGSRAEITGATLPLIGRDQELEAMLAAWAASAAGAGRTVELAAEAGMGKTRLLEEFLARAGAERVIRTDCRLYQSATPYFPFRALLRAAWGFEGLDAAATERALADLITDRAPDLAPWLSLIGAPLDLHLEESPEVSQLEDEFRPARTLAAVGALLEATIAEPTLYVIEDTHWMDEASRALLAGLPAGMERRPWMFALTRRPGEGGFAVHDAEETVRLELGPLGQEQAEALIHTATADHPLLPQQVRTLAQRAEGHPLFLIELLQALRRGGDVEELPHSVEGLIGSRIDRLPTHERMVLRRVAVLGAGFQVEHAASVLTQAEAASPARVLRRLSDFVSMNQTGWVQFRHALIRDVAYQGLPYKTRQDLHLKVAEAIRRSAGDHAEDQAEILSLHYFYAKQWNDAWLFSRVAGDHAKEIYANTEAARFYERALDAERRLAGALPEQKISLLTSLGDVREASGSFEPAFEAYLKASHLSSDTIVRADLHLKRARAKERAGSYRQALREISKGFKLVEQSDAQAAAAVRARLAAFGATVRMAHEQFREAIQQAQAAVAEAKASGEKAALARAYSALDLSYRWLGEADKAVYADEALAIYEELGDLSGMAVVTGNLGVAAYFDGRWQDSLGLHERTREAFLRAGNEVQAAYAAANIGEMLVLLGPGHKAIEPLQEALRVLRASGFVDGAAFAEVQLGRALAEQGEVAAAQGLLEHAYATFSALGELASAVDASVHLATCLISAGHPDEALGVLDRARTLAGAGVTIAKSAVLRTRAAALMELGQADQAGECAAAALAEAERSGLTYDIALAHLLKAEIDQRAGVSTDENATARAAQMLRDLGVRTPRSLLSGVGVV